MPKSIAELALLSQSLKGVNAYATFPSPRSSGTEAIVISASWLSRSGNDTLNLRGIATILALADFLKSGCLFISMASHLSRALEYSLWAKDLVFVVSDGYLDGMQAWLNAYHSTPQSSKSFVNRLRVDLNIP